MFGMKGNIRLYSNEQVKQAGATFSQAVDYKICQLSLRFYNYQNVEQTQFRRLVTLQADFDDVTKVTRFASEKYPSVPEMELLRPVVLFLCSGATPLDPTDWRTQVKANIWYRNHDLDDPLTRQVELNGSPSDSRRGQAKNLMANFETFKPLWNPDIDEKAIYIQMSFTFIDVVSKFNEKDRVLISEISQDLTIVATKEGGSSCFGTGIADPLQFKFNPTQNGGREMEFVIPTVVASGGNFTIQCDGWAWADPSGRIGKQDTRLTFHAITTDQYGGIFRNVDLFTVQL